MLLAIDVGNTNMVIGTFDGKRLRQQWRIETHKERTADELGILLSHLFEHAGLDKKKIDALIISNVVPPLQYALDSMAKRYLEIKPMNVGPEIRIPMKVLTENPTEVGADRIVNGVAAYHKYKKAVIVVDFGTATTFDYITPKGDYAGGAIAPGIMISNEALAEHASKLPRVEIARPRALIGRTTIQSMQSGIYFGYVGLVDEIVNRMKKEVKTHPRVVATGGLAGLIAKDARTIEKVDPLLTLEGLRLLHEFNRPIHP